MNNLIHASQAPLGLYIHLPWCLHKCPYCDFNSHATEKNTFPEQQYVEALIKDLAQESLSISTREVQSIFIGGGTPSLFSPKSIEMILASCHEYCSISSQCEITLETNPGTFENQKFSDFFHCGINRLSIGVQSLNNQHLKALERIHERQEAIQAINVAHSIGFDNINADLMYGLPQQTLSEAQQDIQQLCQQPLTHISYYQLTIEPNTIFHRYPPLLPSDDDVWAMHNNAQEILQQNGFQRYEVSAYHRNKKMCLHNTNYWQFGDYLGIGAGAHSKLSTIDKVARQQRIRQPNHYIQAVNNNTHIINHHSVNANELMFEFMLNNLRLMQGFTQHSFTFQTGLDWAVIASKIQGFIDEGLIKIDQDHYRATALGYRFLDELTQRFLPDN